MNQPVLSVRLNAGYQKQQVLKELRFDLFPGDRLGLLGPSGTGKSTLLLAILGLLRQRGGWAHGDVLIQGHNILAMRSGDARRFRGRAFSLIPQSPLTALNPALTLQRHFEEAWKAHRPKDKTVLQNRLSFLLERVSLPSGNDFLKRKPGQVSVGQAQRCTIALALLHQPAVIIADEPTSSLDPATQTEVLDLLREVTLEQEAALLFVSHDLLSVLRLCTGVAVLSGGRLTERLPMEDIVLAQEPALRKLLDALPVPAHVLLEHVKHQNRSPEPVFASLNEH